MHINISPTRRCGSPHPVYGLDLTVHCAGSGGHHAGAWLTALGGESCPMQNIIGEDRAIQVSPYAIACWSDAYMSRDSDIGGYEQDRNGG